MTSERAEAPTQLNDLVEELRRIRVALERIAQSVNPEEVTVQPTVEKKEEKKAWKSYKELNAAMKENAPTLVKHIKNARRFSTGNYLVQIDYVDKDEYRKIAEEAKALGGQYSKKYRGFIFQGVKA